jgi:hypothetical protein
VSRVAPRDVFINCPFSDEYRPIFEAIVFSVQACGMRARCALEADNGAQMRIEKITAIIRCCPFGIHDISFMDLDANTQLPRLNMAFELGLFLGARWLGTKSQRSKSALILDRERYRYQAAISDIAGPDIKDHRGDPLLAARRVRDWLHANAEDAEGIRGAAFIRSRYHDFCADLPQMKRKLDLEEDELASRDLSKMIGYWLQQVA